MNKKLSIAAIITAIFFTIIYALFPTKMHFVDGLGYAHALENSTIAYEWHPHHPIWLPIIHLLYNAVIVIVPGLTAMTFFAISNSILSGLSIYLFIRFVALITKNSYASYLAGILYGASWGMMTYSGDANIYILVIVLLLIISHILLSGEYLTRRSAENATALILITCLIHQMSFFFTFVVLAAILIRSPRKERFRVAVTCTAIYAMMIYAANYIVYLIAKPMVEIEIETSFMQWLTAYGSTPVWWTMFSRGFLSAQEIFCFSQINLFLHTPKSELIYHASHYEGTSASPLYIAFHILIFMYFIWEIVSLFTKRKIEPRLRQIRILMLTWFGIYFVFNQFYCAFEVHYKLFYLPPLLTLWALRLLESKGKVQKTLKIAVPILIAIIAVWNFTTGMLPNSKPETSPFLAEVLDLKPLVKKGDLVLFSRQQYYIALLFRYYTDADGIPYRFKFNKFAVVEEGFLEIDRQTVEYMKNRYNRVFLSNHAYECRPRQWYFMAQFFPPPHPPLMALHPSSVEKIDELESEKGEFLHQVELKPAIRYRIDMREVE